MVQRIVILFTELPGYASGCADTCHRRHIGCVVSRGTPFDPPALQVPAGTTVTWRNNDHFTHSVSVAGGKLPFLNLPPGQSGALTFDQPGAYSYICTYHAQDMKGTVIVVAR